MNTQQVGTSTIEVKSKPVRIVVRIAVAIISDPFAVCAIALTALYLIFLGG